MRYLSQEGATWAGSDRLREVSQEKRGRKSIAGIGHNQGIPR
jgi:hypothetical protein